MNHFYFTVIAEKVNGESYNVVNCPMEVIKFSMTLKRTKYYRMSVNTNINLFSRKSESKWNIESKKVDGQDKCGFFSDLSVCST